MHEILSDGNFADFWGKKNSQIADFFGNPKIALFINQVFNENLILCSHIQSMTFFCLIKRRKLEFLINFIKFAIWEVKKRVVRKVISVT